MSSVAYHDSNKVVSPSGPAQDDIPLQTFLEATPAVEPPRTIYQYAIPEYHAWRFIRPLRRAIWHQKDRAIAVFMFCMIHCLSALFFCYTVPWLLHTRSVAPLVLYIPIYLLNTSSWAFTLFSDPGILPRGLGPGPSPIVPPPLGSDGQLPDNYPFLGTGGTRQLFVGERVILTQKWCVTCHLWRPPRASHCSLCDACIDRHDHHCPWLSNCIGSRNYRFFVAFVASLAAMAIIAFTTSVLLIVDEAAELNPITPDYRKAMATHVGVVILLGGTFIFGWTPLVLSFYHLFLSARNRTTHEALGFENRVRPDLKRVWRHANPCYNRTFFIPPRKAANTIQEKRCSVYAVVPTERAELASCARRGSSVNTGTHFYLPSTARISESRYRWNSSPLNLMLVPPKEGKSTWSPFCTERGSRSVVLSPL